jgi:hypothetical protein
VVERTTMVELGYHWCLYRGYYRGQHDNNMAALAGMEIIYMAVSIDMGYGIAGT